MCLTLTQDALGWQKVENSGVGSPCGPSIKGGEKQQVYTCSCSGLSVGHTSRRKGIPPTIPPSPLSESIYAVLSLCFLKTLMPCLPQNTAISLSCDKCHIYLTQNVAKTCVYLDPTQGYNTTSLTLLSSPVNLHERAQCVPSWPPTEILPAASRLVQLALTLSCPPAPPLVHLEAMGLAFEPTLFPKATISRSEPNSVSSVFQLLLCTQLPMGHWMRACPCSWEHLFQPLHLTIPIQPSLTKHFQKAKFKIWPQCM